MLGTNTFLTRLYVTCDDFCQQHIPPQPLERGRPRSLSCSEVLTLGIFCQWHHFSSERAFYRWAGRHLKELFPRLPHRSQFNRLMRHFYAQFVAFWQFLTRQLRPGEALLNGAIYYYEAIDATAVATRHCGRRRFGWLPGQADKGLGSRLGWYHGFYLLATSDRYGVITGWCFGPASAKEQPMATAFLQARAHPHPRLPTVGDQLPVNGFYLSDSGFQGQELHDL